MLRFSKFETFWPMQNNRAKNSILLSEAGFSLIELLIVLVIIGILAGLAIPRYMAYTTRSKQAEAKGLLNQIYLSERAYFQSHDTYWIPQSGIIADRNNSYAFDTLGVEVMKSARYRYEITGDDESFTAMATADHLDDDPAIDQWIIDQSGYLQVVSDDSILR